MKEQEKHHHSIHHDQVKGQDKHLRSINHDQLKGQEKHHCSIHHGQVKGQEKHPRSIHHDQVKGLKEHHHRLHHGQEKRTLPQSTSWSIKGARRKSHCVHLPYIFPEHTSELLLFIKLHLCEL